MEPIQVLILLVFAVVILGAITWVNKRANSLDPHYYNGRWEKVQKALNDGESGQRLAVIDADKLLDHALKARRMSGSSMGERLRSAEGLLGKNYQNIWDAHKLRNRLVHEEVALRGNQVRFAMKAYQKGLKDLGAL